MSTCDRLDLQTLGSQLIIQYFLKAIMEVLFEWLEFKTIWKFHRASWQLLLNYVLDGLPCCFPPSFF